MPAIQIMAIMILGQLLGKNFCEFYRDRVNELRKKRFKIVSYSWFLRLRERVVFDLLFFLKYKSTTKGDCFFIDSTPIKVCKNQRISRHKTFKGFAARGHHSMGWFFGFKLHLIVNNRGEWVKFRVTQMFLMFRAWKWLKISKVCSSETWATSLKNGNAISKNVT